MFSFDMTELQTKVFGQIGVTLHVSTPVVTQQNSGTELVKEIQTSLMKIVHQDVLVMIQNRENVLLDAANVCLNLYSILNRTKVGKFSSDTNVHSAGLLLKVFCIY